MSTKIVFNLHLGLLTVSCPLPRKNGSCKSIVLVCARVMCGTNTKIIKLEIKIIANLKQCNTDRT